jgi:hypothetical protein
LSLRNPPILDGPPAEMPDDDSFRMVKFEIFPTTVARERDEVDVFLIVVDTLFNHRWPAVC